MQNNVKYRPIVLPAFSCTMYIKMSLKHLAINEPSFVSSYRVIRYQTFKIGKNVQCNIEGYHKDKHIFCYWEETELAHSSKEFYRVNHVQQKPVKTIVD